MEGTNIKLVVILGALALAGCQAGDPGGAQGETDGGSSSSAGSTSGSSAGTASSAGSTSGGSGASEDDDGGSSGGSTGGDTPSEPSSDPLDGLPTGEDQWEQLCARGHGDAIAAAFCAGDSPPQVTSLTELLNLIGLQFEPGNISNGENGNPGFTIAYHSTAVSGRFVNPLNPRAFVFTPPVGGVMFPPADIPDPNLVMAGFARGEPFVELVAKDPIADVLRFYLFRYDLACEADPAGCTNADLLTPAVESGFVGYSLYDDDDVGNTVLDCLQCHQPDGPGTPKMLRMQEFEEGWTHWFYPNRPQNREVMETFVDAHEGEAYGGIPAEALSYQALLENGEGAARPVPFHLVLRAEGFTNQPNAFLTEPIRAERGAAGCSSALQPTSSCSPTWDAIYAEAVAGNEIGVPYFDGHITDPDKLSAAAISYRATMLGVSPAEDMDDIRDVLLDEAAPYMSYAPAPGLDGRGILDHMCKHCHNSSLDQSISRAKFNVEELDSLPDWTKEEAIRRLQLPVDDIERMPPERFHTLSAEEIELVVGVLSE